MKGKRIKITTEPLPKLKADQKREASKILSQIMQLSENMARKDIKDWLNARRAALDITYPNRARLQELYNMLVLDLHVKYLMRKIKLFLTSADFQLIDEAGNMDEDATDNFKKKWFEQYMKEFADSQFFGMGLLQAEDIDPDSGSIKFTLVNRKHVVPNRGAWIKYQTDTTYNVYRDTDAMKWLIEVGDADDLGMLDAMAHAILFKKNAYMCWSEFGERFGMPLVSAKTNTRDSAAVAKLESFLKKMASASYAILDEGDTLELHEQSKTDSFNVYDKLMERSNSEMSKAVILNIMSGDIGQNGSRAQAEIHSAEGEAVADEIRKSFTQHVNETLLPFMTMHGFKLDKLRFQFIKTVKVSAQQFEQDKWLEDNFEIDEAFWAQRYGVPIKKRKDVAGAAKGNSNANLKAIVEKMASSDFIKTIKLHAEIDKLYNKHCSEEHDH